MHISEEITFLENYEYLVEQRFGSKIRIIKDLYPHPHNHYLLPHTFLVVLEYIIGNNTMSASNPLTIEISFKNSFLFFRYVQQKKPLQHAQLKEQFASLDNSYRQSGNEITITKDDFLQQQSIRIPLISI